MRNRNRKNKKSGRNKSIKSLQTTPMSQSIKSNSPKKGKIRILNIISIIGTLVTIIGAITYYKPIMDLFKTRHEKYEDETFLQGDLKPNKILKKSDQYKLLEVPINLKNYPISDSNPKIKGILIPNLHMKEKINIELGSNLISCYTEDLYNGVEIYNPPTFDIYLFTLYAHDDRLYVSTEFKDLKKEETIGIIEFNHWKLYKDNLFDYKDDSVNNNRLQVWDKQHNIAFSIKYSETGDTVSVMGYFIGPYSISILTPTGSITNGKGDSDWKEISMPVIKKIPSIF